MTAWKEKTNEEVIEVYAASKQAEAQARAKDLLAPDHVYGSIVSRTVRGA